jgi:hypothetical protein
MESFVDAAYPRPTANNVGFVHLIRVLSKMIGTVRRECLDLVLVFGEAHLRQILSSYAAYYNEIRTHLALGKDAPLGRAGQRTGVIVAIPILSGLHHHYVRI